MTPESILSRARELLCRTVDLSIDDGRVLLYHHFGCVEDREPGDVAWDRLCDFQDDLQPGGLCIRDPWSDNDSLGGVVIVDPHAPPPAPACPWEADLEKTICPKHGGTLMECPMPHGVMSAGPTFLVTSEMRRPS